METVLNPQGMHGDVRAGGCSARATARDRGPAAPGSAAGQTEGRTREAVIRLVLAEGPVTAATLAARLGVTQAGIRRHLEALVAEGTLTSREVTARGRRGRGRPARAYLLTDTGRGRLPHAYDELANDALEALAEAAGPEAVTRLGRRRAEAIVASRAAELGRAESLPAKIDVLAGALTDAGYAASVGDLGHGIQLCQHHCPVAHVAARFPQLCEAELAVFTEALGSYAQRLATIGRGDSFCTTFIPTANVATYGRTAS